MEKYTKKMFDQQFPDDNSCLDWLRNMRWPERIECPSCQKANKFHKVTGRKVYECDYCGYQLSPTADTILHKSSTSLRDWFYAVFLMANTRVGISAKQLERELGVTYKTAWRMFTQIRKMMEDNTASLFGQVEVDETYIGGKRPGKRGRGAAGKVPVMGIVQRKGKAVVKVISNVRAKTVLPIIQEHIPAGEGTIVYTDELASYNRLSSIGFTHEVILHSAKQYVNGAAHVNNVEGIWSHIKLGLVGVHRHVSPKYLQGYLDSYVYKYNHRKDTTPMFLQILGLIPFLAS